jgi:phosphopantothenoylcysteine decarboxylase/phosphopantothenate--cysteine ligase
VTRYWAESANDMYQQVKTHLAPIQIFIATAAVADYAPQTPATRKIKKTAETDTLTLTLQKNVDILASVSHKNPHLFTVGFAAETENVEHYARGKLNNKKLNMIAANQVGHNQGFDVDQNTLLVIWQGGQQRFPMTSKTQLAEQLMQLISQHYIEEHTKDKTSNETN